MRAEGKELADLPKGWQALSEGFPTESGVYPCLSINPPKRVDEPEDWLNMLCHYDVETKLWQHVSGFYDHGLTHWLPLQAILPDYSLIKD